MEDFIVKIYLRENKSMLAQVEVMLGPVKMIGFRVMKNRPEYEGDDIYVTEPRYLVNGKYISAIFIENKELWATLQKKIKDAYYKALEGRENELGSVHPDEIFI